jgi:hypothetical protein
VPKKRTRHFGGGETELVLLALNDDRRLGLARPHDVTFTKAGETQEKARYDDQQGRKLEIDPW